MKWWHWLLIGGALIVVTGSKALARNVRNNNPLNIEYNPANPWQGQIGNDGRFCIFKSADYGFRAAAIIVKKYQRDYKLDTLRKIITRWAPPSENDTEAYIRFVSAHTGLAADKPVTLANEPLLFAKVLVAMSRMEGAGDTYTVAEASKGVMIA